MEATSRKGISFSICGEKQAAPLNIPTKPGVPTKYFASRRTGNVWSTCQWIKFMTFGITYTIWTRFVYWLCIFTCGINHSTRHVQKMSKTHFVNMYKSANYLQIYNTVRWISQLKLLESALNSYFFFVNGKRCYVFSHSRLYYVSVNINFQLNVTDEYLTIEEV